MAEEILLQRPLVQDELTQLAGAEDQLWRAEEYRRLLGPDNYAALMRQLFGPMLPLVEKCRFSLFSEGGGVDGADVPIPAKVTADSGPK